MYDLWLLISISIKLKHQNSSINLLQIIPIVSTSDHPPPRLTHPPGTTRDHPPPPTLSTWSLLRLHSPLTLFIPHKMRQPESLWYLQFDVNTIKGPNWLDINFYPHLLKSISNQCLHSKQLCQRSSVKTVKGVEVDYFTWPLALWYLPPPFVNTTPPIRHKINKVYTKIPTGLKTITFCFQPPHTQIINGLEFREFSCFERYGCK